MITKYKLKVYNKIYNDLYENGYKSELVKMGQCFIKMFPEVCKAMILARRDYISSDRELAAFAIWFMKYYNNEFLKGI